MYINAKDLMRFNIKPFLFGVLFSRLMTDDITEIPKMFYIYTYFKTSKAVNFTDFDFCSYSEILVNDYNTFSGYENWQIKSVTNSSMELRFYIKNDLEIKTSEFYNLIYKKIMQEDWVYDETLSLKKRQFLIGFMETRGSIDLSANYISQDYFYDNRFELKRIQLITDYMNIPYSFLNLNPRNLQPDFISGKRKRNMQFRINIHYYSRFIGYINRYKAMIYSNNWKVINEEPKNGIITFKSSLPKMRESIAFIKYLNFFTNNIYEKDLNAEKILALRNALGFNKDELNVSKTSRNRTIIEIFDSIAPDQCGLCDTKETFIKNNGRQAFEIHHVIPYFHGKQYDNIANLIKLCPTCHSSFKKGRSTMSEQVKNIIVLLHKHPEIYEYTSSVLGIENITELATEIQHMLG